MGRGEERPVSDNKSQTGRANNRRVEVFLAQVVSGRLKDRNDRIDVDKAAVAVRLKNARTQLREKKVSGALQIFCQARAQ